MLFADEDGVEVFEVDGDKRDADAVAVVSTKSRVRPNDPCPC